MTLRSLGSVLVSLAIASGCTQRTPEEQLVYEAGEALGGASTIAETTTLVLEGQGEQYRLGQNVTPTGTLPYWELDDYRREIDLRDARWRTSHRRTSMFLTGSPVLQEPQTFGIDGDVAYDIDEAGVVMRRGMRVVSDRQADHYHHPATLVRLALAEGTTLDNLREAGAHEVVDITSATGQTFTMSVDRETRLPSRITSRAYHPVLGDVTLSTRFDDYWETGGLGFGPRLTLPREISQRIDTFETWHLRVTSQVDRELDGIEAPGAARAAAMPEFRPVVEVEEVRDGVWRLAGQSHHSVLVEFSDYLALVEAPLNEARTLAVIEAARGLQPDKPLRYLVSTHHHFDHTGGIRAAVAEGLTIVTHQRNEQFYRDLVDRDHTIEPDLLAASPQELQLELIEGSAPLQLGEGRRTMNIARIAQDEHASGILMACLPRERILIEADAYSPSADVAPFAPNLLAAVEEMGWRVDTIVPIHGPVVEFAALREAAEREALRR